MDERCVTLTGFQLLQLLGMVGHSATARIAVHDDGNQQHARQLGTNDKVWLPKDGAQAEAAAQRRIERETEERLQREALQQRGGGM